MTKYYKKGAIVKVLAGKEIGQIFVILDIEDNYAFLINGKSRPITHPKKKNFKHLYLLEKSCELNFDNLNNSDVIKFLKDYKSKILGCK